MFRYSVGTIALASIFSTTITAQAADTRLEDIVVTASRTEQKVTDVIGDVSVITEDQIQKAGQTTLVELLGMQPGIEISSNGGVGKSSDIFIRGANATHTLILVDGVRISSATTGVTAIQHIPLSQIEHVEILRGPASAMYGADAVGGVIQIFTKSGKGSPKFNASAGLGTYGTAIGDAGVSGRISNTSYSLQGGMTHVNGISTIKNKTNRAYNPDADGYRNQNISAKITQHLDQDHEVGLSILVSDSRSFNDSGRTITAARFDYFLEQTLSSYTLHSKNRFNQYWTSVLSISRSIDDLTSYTKRPTFTTKDIIKTTQDQYLWQNNITTPAGLFNLGIERREQEVETNSMPPLPVTQRDIQSYLAGWQKNFDKNSFQINLRNDDNSQFGSKATGSIAYAYQLTPAWKANAAFGTAFAAPTFNQLYYPNFGNADLKPEKSRNKEIGIHYDKGAHRLGATYYLNEVDDLIINPTTSSSPTSNFTGVTQNISEARLSGLTLSYQGKLAGLDIRANGDLQRPEDRETGNLLPRRAREHGTLAISKRMADWEIGSEIESSGHRYNDAENQVRMSGYTLVNLYTNYRINDDWALNARVNNLFDRNYELTKDYGTYGTNLFVSVRFTPSM
ncbi:TonB-dependent receptor [Methylobacillus caricis]|uniref:TonB-dependent receptor domain-containing protein n=1 Tax=Methylobacillus caricis TaxID=1971611 RepID=UPI001CFF961A|nr:TonB-dependent receptor [Methylobacillus caricis]MCB5188261.1 TonB-dependent receptor [Methylobacillus caricis]